MTDFPESLDEDLRFHAVRIRARGAITLPTGGRTPTGLPFGLDDPDEERLEAYMQLRNRLLDAEPHHLLLGCPLADEDSADDPDEASRRWPSLHAEAVGYGLSTDEPPPGEWQMLLQISSDPERLGAEFGDGGTLMFAIPTGDLAVGRFDRVQAYTDSL